MEESSNGVHGDDRNVDGDAIEPTGSVLADMQPSGAKRHIAVLALLSVVLMVSVSLRIMNLPLNRILEQKFCHGYYRQHDPTKIGEGTDIPESQCKLDPIQSDLGRTQGAFETIMLACGTLRAARSPARSDGRRHCDDRANGFRSG